MKLRKIWVFASLFTSVLLFCSLLLIIYTIKFEPKAIGIPVVVLCMTLLIFITTYYGNDAFIKTVRIPIKKFNIHKFDNVLILEYCDHAFIFKGIQKQEILDNENSIEYMKAECYYSISKTMTNVILTPMIKKVV